MKKLIALVLIAAGLVVLSSCAKKPLNQNSSPDLADEAVEIEFLAKVIKITDEYALVQPLEGEDEANGTNQLVFGIKDLDFTARAGDIIKITYDGVVLETYPGQIKVSKCEMHTPTALDEFEGEWLNKQSAVLSEETKTTSVLVIDKIYSNCFVARFDGETQGYTLKINGFLPEGVSDGDVCYVTYGEIYIDDSAQKIECEFISLKPIDDK